MSVCMCVYVCAYVRIHTYVRVFVFTYVKWHEMVRGAPAIGKRRSVTTGSTIAWMRFLNKLSRTNLFLDGTAGSTTAILIANNVRLVFKAIQRQDGIQRHWKNMHVNHDRLVAKLHAHSIIIYYKLLNIISIKHILTLTGSSWKNIAIWRWYT